MSVNSGNDNWGPAMNLGSSVNTKLNELSPTFTAFQNVLFFSSDGHEGYGGLDMYMAKTFSTGETVLYNLGVPFNSNRDDSFISFANVICSGAVTAPRAREVLMLWLLRSSRRSLLYRSLV